jgi:hypothetical protein
MRGSLRLIMWFHARQQPPTRRDDAPTPDSLRLDR